MSGLPELAEDPLIMLGCVSSFNVVEGLFRLVAKDTGERAFETEVVEERLVDGTFIDVLEPLGCCLVLFVVEDLAPILAGSGGGGGSSTI